jgi:hypothetical protein
VIFSDHSVKTHGFAARNRISMDADKATHDPTTRCCPRSTSSPKAGEMSCREAHGLEESPERAQVKVQIVRRKSEMVAKLTHATFEEHQRAPDALDLFGSHRARIKPAYGLPFHQLPKQLNQREYKLHQAALDCLGIGSHPASQRIESVLRDLVEWRRTVIENAHMLTAA